MSFSSPMIVLINLLIMVMVFNFACSRVIEESKENLLLQELSDTHLLMAAHPSPPWFNERLEANGTYTYWGFNILMCDYIARALNATYSFVRTREDEERQLGRKGAIYKLMMRGEVNISTKFESLVYSECNRVDCSIPLHTSKTNLLVPWPEEEGRILAPIRPFQLEIWILIPISTICVALTMIYLPKFYKKCNKSEKNDNNQDVGTVAIYLLTGEGDWNQWKNRLSFRIIQGTWCLAAFVLLNAYSSTIISYLTAPKLMPVTKTLKELASGSPQRIKLLTEINDTVATICLMANDGQAKILGDSLRKYPESLFKTKTEGLDKLMTKQYGYIAAEMRVMPFLDLAYKKAGNHCALTVSNTEIWSSTKIVWTFPKHWRYTNVVNDKMKWFAESGLASYWYKKDMPKLDQCQLDNYAVASAEKRVLSLYDLMGPFLFLLAGISVSFLTFLMEIIVFKFRKQVQMSRIISA